VEASFLGQNESGLLLWGIKPRHSTEVSLWSVTPDEISQVADQALVDSTVSMVHWHQVNPSGDKLLERVISVQKQPSMGREALRAN